ncbi:translation initiation factor IF-2 [Marchantia polymorpha subsp. ruderalis]|uniref:Translation initiation factor IF-2, chloroplastic n=2 Tax=Marchantia polymorpha TaxID=3197 RepID=A0A176WQT9_MARPO|nr:hypothetical protein AXG93_2189s1110 [Marchantia polymorpha subsp. ruderalis]PTQ33823.1 hypothetical protein MARPO_0085s0042 [Marchantia polymorpha]BBN05050.1 hypothetical protein Mp_3g09840 [Marchantia polymorpha subsp. ruderalis]|eukprot:PTQ33823.1 hypothetical protein MARPO_0085s0042 [Marchantia polymorpha]
MAALSVTAGVNSAHCVSTSRFLPTVYAQSGASLGSGVNFQRRRGTEHVSVLCTGCECVHLLSPAQGNVQPLIRMSLLNAHFDSRMRISFRGVGRRSLLGKAISRRTCRKGVPKCVATAATSTEDVTVRSLLEEDEAEVVPPLSNKPVFTMRPPVKPTTNDENSVPALKPNPRPPLKLKLRNSAPSSPAQSGRINGDSEGTSANRLTLKGSDADRDTSDGPNADSSYKAPYRPSEKSEPGNSVQSLGQILKKVEDMEKDAPAEARKPAFTPSNRPRVPSRTTPQATSPQAWRPGQTPAAAPAPEAGQETSRNSGAGRDMIQSFRPDANFRAQPRTTTVRPKPAAGASTTDDKPARKGPILRDVGAGPRTSRPSSSAAPASTTAPPKFTKAAPIKGKEDWRKKAAAGVSDGSRRRMVSKSKDADAATGDLDIAIPGVGSGRRGRKFTKASRKAAKAELARAAAPVKVEILEVGKEGMSVQDLAAKLAINDGEVVKTLFMKGIATMVNQTLDEEAVRLVCKEFEVEVVEAGTLKVEDMAKKLTEFLDEEDLDFLEIRPPVVTIMGHVDHGKTSLLDHIRKSKVAAGEAGGITQGIGAYRVLVPVGEEKQACVFLDTPGHQAFSAMRARGARVTDIAVIVVAADDGVRPQTLEAIAHAKAANVPIVVAINKIDKDGANAERVMQELASNNLMIEDWGGDVPAVQVSAKTGQNVDSLLETIMLLAEIADLRANPDRSAKGTVIEACLDKTRGTLATLLIQNGTLRKGDVVLCGESYGKVRALLDDTGARVEEAGPSTAVQVIGLNNVPVAGDEFEICDSIDAARDRAAERAIAIREQRLADRAGEGKVTLASLANAVAAGQESGTEHHQLNIILKVDVQGSVEAIREALQELPQDTVGLRFLLQSAGEVSASDVDLAIASQAIVIAFNVGVPSAIQSMAEKEGVEIREYNVIYELLDDMRKAMEGLLEVVTEQIPIGQADVRAVFGSGSGRVAGCMVTEGKLVKGCGVRVMRGNNAVYTGTLDSLKRVKELAKEVAAGLECGVGVTGFAEWQEGDRIEAYNEVDKRRSLEEASVNTVDATASVRTT